MSTEKQPSRAMKGNVQIGDHAPLFALRTQNGTTVNLEDFLGKSAVVLYFYPKDDWTLVTSRKIGE